MLTKELIISQQKRKKKPFFCFTLSRNRMILAILYRKRLEKTIEDLDKKQDTQREALGKLQQQLQQAQVKAAMKA